MLTKFRTQKLFATVLLLTLSLGVTPLKAGEFSNGFGSGIQYGGIAGWQGAYLFGRNKARLSIGYAGYTIGYDRYLSTHTSLGGQVFANQYRTGVALSVNYNVNGTPGKGWVAGVDLYSGYDTGELLGEIYWDFLFDPESLGDNEFETRSGAFISVGLHF